MLQTFRHEPLANFAGNLVVLWDYITIWTHSFKIRGIGTWKIRRSTATEVLAQQHGHFDKLPGNCQQEENSQSVHRTSQNLLLANLRKGISSITSQRGWLIIRIEQQRFVKVGQGVLRADISNTVSKEETVGSFATTPGTETTLPPNCDCPRRSSLLHE